MKLSVSKTALHAAITHLSKCSPRGTAQVPDAVRIEVRGNRAAFRASNGDTSLQHVVGITDGVDGAVLVPARMLRDFESCMPQGIITLKEENNRLTMSVGKVAMTMSLLPIETAPLVSFPSGDGVSIPAASFAEALHQVTAVASADEAKAVLTGILIEARDNGLRLVATDSYRLAVRDVAGVSGLPEGMSIVAPAGALKGFADVFGNAENVIVRLEENQVGFEIDNVKMVTRLIRAPFPSYHTVLQNDASTVAIADRDELMRALRRATVVANDRVTPVVRLAFSPTGNKVDMAVAGTATAGMQEEMPISGTGDDITVNANPAYIITALNGLDTQQVKICFSGPLRPLLVTGANGSEDLRYVVMPSRA